jgi:hypothetical protein
MMDTQTRSWHLLRAALTAPAPGSLRAAWVWGLVLTLTLRVGLGLVMGSAWLAVSPYLPPEVLGRFSLAGKLPMPITFPGNALLGVWLRWDAVHHLNLAMRGYFDLSEGDSVFYPLYAGLTRLIVPVAGGDYLAAGLIVSTLATLAALAGLYRLADLAYGPRSARWAVLALAVYPTAVFLVAPFTESLFLALTLWAFNCANEQKWWCAGVLGCLASLARGPGMLTAAALAILAGQQWQRRQGAWHPPQVAARLWGLVLPVVGGAVFLLWRQAAGFAPMQIVLQRYSGLEMVDPLTGMAAAIVQWVRVHDLPTTLDVWSAGLFLILAIVMAACPRWCRTDWLAFVGLNLVLFLGKRSFTASSLQSMSRYVLVLFPAFVILGDWLATRSQRVRFIYLALSSAALVVLSSLFASGIFVG